MTDRDADARRTAFLFDLDGTLVDSVYQHVLAWREALASVGIELAVWTIHRRIGMSGGLMANAILRETALRPHKDRRASAGVPHAPWTCVSRRRPEISEVMRR